MQAVGMAPELIKEMTGIELRLVDNLLIPNVLCKRTYAF